MLLYPWSERTDSNPVEEFDAASQAVDVTAGAVVRTMAPPLSSCPPGGRVRRPVTSRFVAVAAVRYVLEAKRFVEVVLIPVAFVHAMSVTERLPNELFVAKRFVVVTEVEVTDPKTAFHRSVFTPSV
jgi:hypothetical protein